MTYNVFSGTLNPAQFWFWFCFLNTGEEIGWAEHL